MTRVRMLLIGVLLLTLLLSACSPAPPPETTQPTEPPPPTETIAPSEEAAPTETTTPAEPTNEEVSYVPVFLRGEPEQTVSAGVPLMLRGMWATVEEAQAEEFVEIVETQVLIDGGPLPGSAQLTIESAPTGIEGFPFGGYVVVTLPGGLPAGQYQVTLIWTTSAEHYDGEYTYPPGEVVNNTITLIVE